MSIQKIGLNSPKLAPAAAAAPPGAGCRGGNDRLRPPIPGNPDKWLADLHPCSNQFPILIQNGKVSNSEQMVQSATRIIILKSFGEPLDSCR
jgi:hypothetical protein